MKLVSWFFPLCFSFTKLAVLLPLPFHLTFKIVLLELQKNLAEILIGIMLDLYINLGKTDILLCCLSIINKHMVCPSIYLDLFCFFHLHFIVFSIQVLCMFGRFTPKHFTLLSDYNWYCVFHFNVRMFITNIQKYNKILYVDLISCILQPWRTNVSVLVFVRLFVLGKFLKILYIGKHVICR